VKPRLLDAFCCQGGASRGYQLAGFHVTGVDNREQPRYCGDAFIMGDALDFIRRHGREFQVIHASPPCQHYSRIRRHSNCAGRDYPDLIGPVREALEATGRPYVIENVPGAPLLSPVVLCGIQFSLRVLRHRLFESTIALTAPPACDHRGIKIGEGGYCSVSGHGEWNRRHDSGHAHKAAWSAAMGIDWMTRDGLAQALPPAYTHFVGKQLRAAIGAP
jgi:hypothetical protein